MGYAKKVVVKRIISPDGRVISEAKSVVETFNEEATTSTTNQTVTVRSNYSSSSSFTFVSVSSINSSR
ncbi:MAG: hypothetical protein HC930_09805 [Hydrococcus sp. SU_1_0]|nr:hypothetical protein [Hydrococcus sp. SU_1_0]